METKKIKGITAIKRKGNRTSMYMKKGSPMKKEQTMKTGSKMKSSSKSGDCGCGGKTRMQAGGKLTPNPYLKFTTSRNTRNTAADLTNAAILKDSRLPAIPIAPIGSAGRDPLRTRQADQYTIIDKVTGKLRKRLPSERLAQYNPALSARNIANRIAGRSVVGTSQLTGLPLK